MSLLMQEVGSRWFWSLKQLIYDSINYADVLTCLSVYVNSHLLNTISGTGNPCPLYLFWPDLNTLDPAVLWRSGSGRDLSKLSFLRHDTQKNNVQLRTPQQWANYLLHLAYDSKCCIFGEGRTDQVVHGLFELQRKDMQKYPGTLLINCCLLTAAGKTGLCPSAFRQLALSSTRDGGAVLYLLMFWVSSKWIFPVIYCLHRKISTSHFFKDCCLPAQGSKYCQEDILLWGGSGLTFHFVGTFWQELSVTENLSLES